MSNKINIDLISSNMSAAIERIQESQELIRIGVNEEDVQSVYYGLFEDAIALAGFKMFFHEPKSINKYLKIAANSVIALYYYQGKTLSTLISLPNFKKTTIIDYSVTNPWVFVRGIYAAAICREMNILKDLICIPLEILLKGQEVLPIDLMSFLKFLPSIINNPSIFKASSEETFWSIQTNTLKTIIDGSFKDFSKSIKHLKSFLSKYYDDKKFLNNPERFYPLPLYGLINIKEIRESS